MPQTHESEEVSVLKRDSSFGTNSLEPGVVYSDQSLFIRLLAACRENTT